MPNIPVCNRGGKTKDFKTESDRAVQSVELQTGSLSGWLEEINKPHENEWGQYPEVWEGYPYRRDPED